MENEYIIMHMNYPVVSVNINEEYKIDSINKVYSEERVFPGLYKNILREYNLNDWLFSRGIPAKRNELDDIMNYNKVSSREELVIKNYGLGLTDNYWIQKENENLRWENINFWDNNFTQKNEDIYLGQAPENIQIKEEINNVPVTPNNVSSGMLPKKWKKIDGILYMIKGADITFQEPFNEYIVSQYLDSLNIKHVPYELYWHKDLPYSKCPIMLEKGEELIHASYVKNLGIQNNNTSDYEHYINQCVSLGLPKDIRKDLENMILIDFITANTDRHFSNFGIIRDSETLKAKKLAPLYDHGAAFFTKYPTRIIPNTMQQLKCRSFRNTQWDNIKLVNDFSLLENTNIFILPDLLEKFYNEEYIELTRKIIIIENIQKRLIEILKKNPKSLIIHNKYTNN